jgi:hypothetical protein
VTAGGTIFSVLTSLTWLITALALLVLATDLLVLLIKLEPASLAEFVSAVSDWLNRDR